MTTAVDSSSAAAARPSDVEREVVVDMARRIVPAVPVLVALSAAGWGVDGALSALCGIGLALANLVASAALLGWAARRSPAAVMGAAMLGYVARLGVLTLAVSVLKGQAWVELLPLGLTILVTHLGLLWWETRHLSLSLAFPGVKPRPEGT